MYVYVMEWAHKKHVKIECDSVVAKILFVHQQQKLYTVLPKFQIETHILQDS